MFERPRLALSREDRLGDGHGLLRLLEPPLGRRRLALLADAAHQVEVERVEHRGLDALVLLHRLPQLVHLPLEVPAMHAVRTPYTYTS